ncbi:hypothetical protein WICPIJ_000933 [Wickerhamomyces pijperi]|uniref:Uncharacterized protein n=1 Tax=Wickerhamomyces pijperi TaxID=599730 RepID=A0A9P8QCT6_WICPI|nr:hypothetical protein WICPIJ_000933 [Wickerhamomyces pijperi]
MLHSMTFNCGKSGFPSTSALMICMLNGPVMFQASATLSVISLIRAITCGVRFCGGRTKVASPEWIPAFSTCSETACTMTLPWLATASTSISWAPSMNLEMTTGWSGDTLAALPSLNSNSSSLLITDMAAPERTYEGRTNTGNPTVSANCLASSKEDNSFQAG